MSALNFPQFVALENQPQLNRTLELLDNIGCVLNYVPIRLDHAPDADSHGARAIDAMERIVAFYQHRAQTLSSAHYPIEQFWRVTFDAAKLRGKPVGAAQFWGNDDAFPTTMGERYYSIPPVDGYKTAFFNPPMGIGLPVAELIPLFD